MSAALPITVNASTKMVPPFRLDTANECLCRHQNDGEDAGSHPILSKSGGGVEYVDTAMGVAQRTRGEQKCEKLGRLETDLSHSNRVSMMGELAASLSHELKQPITAAMTRAKVCLRWLAREQPDVERACEATLRVVHDITRAAEIIDSLTSFYKKGVPPTQKLVDVNELLGEMLVLLRGEADRYSISIRTELAADLPKITADRVQLQQVFMNLIINGIQAMKDTAGELTIKSGIGSDGHLLITVTDAGVGLPAEKADQIFDAFFTTKPQGSGMGLAISRSIVESHGGRLWASANNRGRGATFHFTLPTAGSRYPPLERSSVSLKTAHQRTGPQ